MFRIFANLVLVIYLIYFDFLPSSFVTKSSSAFGVNLHTKVNADYFNNLVIRPISSSAVAYIYNSNADKWISQNALWTDFPHYSPKSSVKLSFNSPVTQLEFELLDTKTGKMYKTPKRSIWNMTTAQNVLSHLVTTMAVK